MQAALDAQLLDVAEIMYHEAVVLAQMSGAGSAVSAAECQHTMYYC